MAHAGEDAAPSLPGGEGDAGEDAADVEVSVPARKNWRRKLMDVMFPQLTLHQGREVLSVRRSVTAVALLYASHTLSAWGDRMWQFVASLFLALLYPGSLLLPAVFGFTVMLSVATFGTVVGDFVDRTSRMRVIVISLLVQNGMVALCSAALAAMFGFHWDVCLNPLAFAILTAAVILLGSVAQLATVANTIAIEKDWVVVLADKDKDKLAVLNANMRRIDLLCKLLSPAVTGVFLQHTGPLATTIIVATWNIVSFFGELGLVWLVYKLVPTLANKQYRRQSTVELLGSVDDDDDDEEEEEEEEEEEKEEEDEEEEKKIESDFEESGGNDDMPKVRRRQLSTRSSDCSRKTRKVCGHLLTPYVSIRDGWKIYIRQEVAIVGFSMASLYLTVLGFSGVTSAYLLTQGLGNDLIGVFQGVGAIFGVTGTLVYPFIRRRVGTVRTGLFGICSQLLVLSLCGLSVVVPARRIAGQGESYYAANCSNSSSYENVSEYLQPSVVCFAPSVATGSYAASLNTLTLSTTHSTTPYTLSSNTKPALPSLTQTVTSTPFPIPHPSLVSHSNSATPTHGAPLCSPSVTPSPLPSASSRGVSVALALMVAGIVGCRFGLWTFDLAVSQLVQESVIEEERGVVGGVMNAMNSIMDMLHYVLVMAAPRPEHFGILTFISIGFVSLGAVLFAIYVRKVRGHLFHFRKCFQLLRGQRRNQFVQLNTSDPMEGDSALSAIEEDKGNGERA